MNCAEVDEQIEILFDGFANPALKSMMEKHLSMCRSCAARLEHMEAVRRLLRKSRLPGPLASLDARVMRAFNDRYAPVQTSETWWRNLVFGTLTIPKPAVAMSLVTLCVALFIGISIGRMSATQIILSPPSASAFAVPLVPPSRDNDESAERQPVADRRFALRLKDARLRRGSKTSQRTEGQRMKIRSLESFTVVSDSGANYSTRAAINGFEPITATEVRVIKGREER